MPSTLGYGALISLGITAFSIITTIIPLVFDSPLDTTNSYDLKDIRQLTKNLNITGEFERMSEFEDFYASSYSNKNYKVDCKSYFNTTNIKERNRDILISILSYRDNELKKATQSLKCYIDIINQTKPYPINPTNIQWYPIRQLIMENSTMNKNTEAMKNITKKEDYTCIAIENNNTKKYGIMNLVFNISYIPLNVFVDNIQDKINTKVCSYNEIDAIRSYNEKYNYVLKIMNYNSDSLMDITSNIFKQFLYYLNWFILCTLIVTPVIIFLWGKYDVKV